MHPAPASPPVWLRLLRSLAVIGLAFALVVIFALFVTGCVPGMSAVFEPLFSFMGQPPRALIGITASLVILLPLVLIALASRRGKLTWPVIAVAWLVVAPVLVWLAWDDPAIRQPIALEEFSPAFPGAEQSYAVIMQYSKQHPTAEAKAFNTFKPAVVMSVTTRDPAKWLDFVEKNRAAFESDWAALVPQRRWFAEVAAFPGLGDLTPQDFAADIMAFNVWRTLSQRTCGKATLLAIDGHGDEAIDLLAPQLEVARKLQLSSRTLVRTMIAIVIERMTLETAGIVLDRTPVSAPARARLAAALANENGAPLARRLMLMEYVVFSPVTNRMKLGDLLITAQGSTNNLVRRPLNFLSALFLNPNATTNLYGDYAREIAALAEARELGKLNVRSRDFGSLLQTHASMKNVGGRLLLSMAVPAYSKVVESHWATADERAKLRAKLAAAT